MRTVDRVAVPGLLFSWLVRESSVAFFGSVMGLAGLGLLWRSVSVELGLPDIIGTGILLLAGSLFVALVFLQLMRALRMPEVLMAEWRHPVASAFFGAATICGGLFAVAILPASESLARLIWIPSAGLQLGLLVHFMGRWVTSPTELGQALPVWLIPMVGNAAMSFAGIPLGYRDASWFLAATALVTWVGFLPVLLQRAIFHEPKLPPAMAPALAILVSAPAINAQAWLKLSGQADPVFAVLTFAALFFFLLIVRVSFTWISAPFSRTWWALTFPSTALASCLFQYSQYAGTRTASILAWSGIAFASAVVILVSGLALRAIARNWREVWGRAG